MIGLQGTMEATISEGNLYDKNDYVLHVLVVLYTIYYSVCVIDMTPVRVRELAPAGSLSIMYELVESRSPVVGCWPRSLILKESDLQSVSEIHH